MKPKQQEEVLSPPIWSPAQKVAFRFCFLFFSMTSLTYSNIILILLNRDRDAAQSFLIKPITFLENNIFHIGYKPEMGSTELVSSLFGWLLLFLIILLSIIGTLMWSVADKEKRDYHQLHFWFNKYLVYYLFIVMIGYAVSKIIPTQMPYPDIGSLLTPIGNLTKFNLTWMFIGASSGYERFTGCCELIACLLILFQRTRVLGCLVMTFVLVNVVSLNVYYNIIVKLPSIILLLTTLFLLTPYIPKLISFFYFLKPVSLKEKRYKFVTSWKNYLITLLLIVPAWITYKTIEYNIAYANYLVTIRSSQKLYKVTSFASTNDTISPSRNDTITWRQFAITGAFQNAAVVYNANNENESYNYNFDSTKQLLTLINPGDTSIKYLFKYSLPAKDKMILIGDWKHKQVTIELSNMDINNFTLVKDKIQWMYSAGINP
ncbi:MAG: hypothetical protein M3004_07800 [Bacteroidota bacterium]|nr:hypothetical protein [Bacteroidota bacterium]